MHERRIGIIFLQEVRRNNSDYLEEEGGFLVVLSGTAGEEREWAGVGFILAPWLRSSMVGFTQLSNRLCAIKLKTPRGKLCIINAYAPHNRRPYDERQRFFADLGDLYGRPSGCDVKVLVGDFNARLGRALPNEEHEIGPFSFGRTARVGTPGEFNRDLLLEMCVCHSLAVANTFCDMALCNRPTFREAGVRPMDPITEDKFAQLDLLLVPQWFLPRVVRVGSDRSAALASQHFLVEAELDFDMCAGPQRRREPRPERTALKHPEIRRAFVHAFHARLVDEMGEPSGASIDSYSEAINCSFASAGKAVLPVSPMQPRRPWIRQATLDLITARSSARISGDYETEKKLNKDIRRAAKVDRAEWLNSLVASGSWDGVRRLRKAPKAARSYVQS